MPDVPEKLSPGNSFASGLELIRGEATRFRCVAARRWVPRREKNVTGAVTRRQKDDVWGVDRGRAGPIGGLFLGSGRLPRPQTQFAGTEVTPDSRIETGGLQLPGLHAHVCFQLESMPKRAGVSVQVMKTTHAGAFAFFVLVLAGIGACGS